MATFKFGRAVDIHWYGNEIVGPADTVFSIPDQLYNEFESEFRPIEPSLTWINTNESAVATIIGTSPVSVLTAGTTSTISFSSSTNPNGYLLAADGSGGLIYVPASTSGLTSVVGISPISSAISGGIASVSIDTAALTGLSAETLQTRVKNSSGSTISKGQVVYVTGSDGTNALIGLSTASTEAGSSKTLGIAASTMTNNAFGYIVENGQLSNIDTSAATAGDSVWLGNAPGSLVFGAPPAEPSHSVYLGVVTKANVSTGEILVKVQNGYELNELHDVFTTGVSTALPLVYSSTSSGWVAQALTSVGIANNAVVAAKIDSTGGSSGWVLTANGSGGATFSAVQSASTSVAGVVQLTDSISSTSNTTAATPNSVKSAYDLANLALSDARFEAFNFGTTGSVGNKPKYVLSTTQNNTSGTIFHNEFIPHKNITVSNLAFVCGTAAVSVTLCRFGIYTRSGTTFTLVARTASDTTICNAANTKFTRALDTTGGYPATYDMTAGQEYYISIISVANTGPQNLSALGRASASQVLGVAQYDQTGQTDLVATSTGTARTTVGGMYVEVS